MSLAFERVHAVPRIRWLCCMILVLDASFKGHPEALEQVVHGVFHCEYVMRTQRVYSSAN